MTVSKSKGNNYRARQEAGLWYQFSVCFLNVQHHKVVRISSREMCVSKGVHNVNRLMEGGRGPRYPKSYLM
jgi:hypothetical protein